MRTALRNKDTLQPGNKAKHQKRALTSSCFLLLKLRKSDLKYTTHVKTCTFSKPHGPSQKKSLAHVFALVYDSRQ